MVRGGLRLKTNIELSPLSTPHYPMINFAFKTRVLYLGTRLYQEMVFCMPFTKSLDLDRHVNI